MFVNGVFVNGDIEYWKTVSDVVAKVAFMKIYTRSV